MGVADGNDVLQMREARCHGTFRAPTVEHEAPPHNLGASGRGAQFVGVGHGGHSVGSHEAREFEFADAGRDQCFEKCQFRFGRDGGFVLQTVTHRDVAQDDAGRKIVHLHSLAEPDHADRSRVNERL